MWLAVVQLQLLGGGDARRLLEEAEAAFSRGGDAWGEALAWLGRFMVEAFLGPPQRAAELRSLAAGKPSIVTDVMHMVDVPSLDPRTWFQGSPVR